MTQILLKKVIRIQNQIQVNLFASYLFDGQIQGYDFIANQKLHAMIIFEQSHQFTVLTYFIFHIPHQWAEARI